MLRLSPRHFALAVAAPGAALTASSLILVRLGSDAGIAGLVACLGVTGLVAGAAGTIRTRRQRAKQCHDWVMSAVRSVSEAVIVTDARGTVTAMNGRAESMTGWAQADAVGQPIVAVFRLVDARTHRPVVNPLVSALYKKTAVGPSAETLLVGRDGMERQVQEQAVPIFDDAGRVFAGAVAFRTVAAARLQAVR